MFLSCAIAFSIALTPASSGADDFGRQVTEFSRISYERAKDRSERLNLRLPAAAHEFFEAAIAGDWPTVSNRFERLMDRDGVHRHPHPAVRNELWAPIHETIGIHEVWAYWKNDTTLLAMFHEPVLASMPEGSIYFGGTDHGRFVISTANAVRDPPPVFCLTQNALADNTYMSALRDLYGDRIRLPDNDAMNRAFQQYVKDVQEGRIPAGAEVFIKDGRVSVQGVKGVMMINGILARMIFDANRDGHDFFIEESYVIDWMYPHLEPHGLILKLHRSPLERWTDDITGRDRAFWRDYEGKLFAHPGFEDNTEARKAFSKLRSAIAGVYEYRRLYDEAEGAYRQAIRLYPASPEASFRLAEMFASRDQYQAAQDVMTAFIALDPPHNRERAEDYLRQLTRKAPGDASTETIHLIDGRTLEAENLRDEGSRLQFRSGQWDYNLPSYFRVEEAPSQAMAIRKIVVDHESIIGPDGPLASFDELAAYLTQHATRETPILVELVDPVQWDEYRRLTLGEAYGAMRERPHAGIQGAWPFRPYAPTED